MSFGILQVGFQLGQVGLQFFGGRFGQWAVAVGQDLQVHGNHEEPVGVVEVEGLLPHGGVDKDVCDVLVTYSCDVVVGEFVCFHGVGVGWLGEFEVGLYPLDVVVYVGAAEGAEDEVVGEGFLQVFYYELQCPAVLKGRRS